jgi:hypothetical protein
MGAISGAVMLVTPAAAGVTRQRRQRRLPLWAGEAIGILATIARGLRASRQF